MGKIVLVKIDLRPDEMKETPIFIFKSVWYRKSVPVWRDFKIIAYDDKGTLTVYADHLCFSGSRFTFPMRAISATTFGYQGRDFINYWLKVEYDQSSVALFADGRWGGWSGLLGGTRKIFNSYIGSVKAQR